MMSNLSLVDPFKDCIHIRVSPFKSFLLKTVLIDNLTRAPLGLVNSGALQKTARTRGILGRQAPLSRFKKPYDYGASISASIMYQLKILRLIDAHLHLIDTRLGGDPR